MAIPDIRIRSYQPGDAAPLFDAVRASAAVLSPWMPWCTPDYSMSDARIWVESQANLFLSGAAYEFAILSAEGRYLGACGINRIDAMNRVANLGYWVRSDAHGKGIATAAARLAVNFAFEHTEMVRLDVLIAETNYASRRVAEKLGARAEGTLRSRLYLHGVSHDAVLFSILRKDANS